MFHCKMLIFYQKCKFLHVLAPVPTFLDCSGITGVGGTGVSQVLERPHSPLTISQVKEHPHSPLTISQVKERPHSLLTISRAHTRTHTHTHTHTHIYIYIYIYAVLLFANSSATPCTLFVLPYVQNVYVVIYRKHYFDNVISQIQTECMQCAPLGGNQNSPGGVEMQECKTGTKPHGHPTF